MKNINSTLAYLSLISVLAMSCGKNPKVITTGKPDDNTSATGVFSEGETVPVITTQPAAGAGGDDVHSVKVMESLPTSKYIYLRVTEGGEEFWIATIKTDVTIGATYFFRDGLLKTNFESKEYKRVFDKLYLVSTLVREGHGGQEPMKIETHSTSETDDVVVKGSIRIADLVASPKKYAGKMIRLSGKCVKINSNIMGRNWIHLQDGSKNDYDLVVTSSDEIPVGHTITVNGKVSLDKDFGSGYQYDILVEDATIVH